MIKVGIVTAAFLAPVAFGGLPRAGAPQECRARPGAPKLDHVIIAVRDLDSLAARFSALGFRIKNGRPHLNGLLNKHVKFRDGTEIELMTVAGPPTDRMSQEYAALIAEQDGGAYVALRLASLDSAEAIATRMGLGPRRSSAGPWQFLSFEPRSPLGAVFFVAGGVPANDPDSIFSHADSTGGMGVAWVAGGKDLLVLLEALGGQVCEENVAPGHLRRQFIALEGSSLAVFPMPASGRFPRPGAIGLDSPHPPSPQLTPIPVLSSFHLYYR